MNHCPNCGASSWEFHKNIRIFNRFTPFEPRRADVQECKSCYKVFERINCMDHPESERWRFLPYSIEDYKQAESNQPETDRRISEIVFVSYNSLRL